MHALGGRKVTRGVGGGDGRGHLDVSKRVGVGVGERERALDPIRQMTLRCAGGHGGGGGGWGNGRWS